MMTACGSTINQTTECSKDEIEKQVEIRTADLKRDIEKLNHEIAQLKRVEAELNNSRQQLLDIIDFLPDATFVIDNNDKVIAWNRAIEEMSGVSKEEMVGQGDYAFAVPFYGKRRPHLLNLLDVPDIDLASKYQHIQRQGAALRAEVFVPAVYNGKGAYVWVIAAPLFDTDGKRIGAIESIRDISQRKQMEDELAHRIMALTSPVTNISDVQFGDLFDLEEIQKIQDAFSIATGVASIITDINGRPMTRPSNFCRLCSDIIRSTEKGLANCYHSDNMLGKVHTDGPIAQPCLSGGLWDGGASISVGDRHIANWLIGQVLDESCEMDVMMKYAREIGADEVAYRQALSEVNRMSVNQFKEVCNALFLIAGQLSCLATQNLQQARHITERKRAEEERRIMESQLLQAQKLESLGVLAGGIAHDFNNILMAIIGNADLALMRLNPDSPIVENLHRIEQTAARAAELAKQMLAYSGRGKFVVECLDMNRLLEEMLHMLDAAISKKVILRLNLYRPLPTVEVDVTQMRQIIMHLVINASEAIGDKSGVITITSGFMDCDRKYLNDMWYEENISEGLYVSLEIADNGCGMDKETMAKVFDPFFTTKFIGRGLGMAAVMGIVRGHKGAIKVYSEPGRGTTFKMLLPASSKPAENYIGEYQRDVRQGRGSVLLVDDEETVRSVGSEMLRALGFQVITAEDGKQALEQFKNNPDIILVILDLTMPRMDGEQCFRELMQLKPDLKVIMSSGYNEQEVAQRFEGKGLTGFIQKPYKLTELREALSCLDNTQVQ